MAQGVAWMARLLGVPATIVVPEHAPAAKITAIERLGGTVVRVPYADWWRALEEGSFAGTDGHFVHPVAGRRRDGRQRHDRARARRSARRVRHRPDPVGRRWPDDRDRQRAGPDATRRSRRRLRARDGCATDRGARGGCARRDPVRAVVRRRRRRQGTPPGDVGDRRPLVSSAVTVSLDDTAAAIRLLATRAASSPRARARSRWRPRRRDSGHGTVVCIVSGGNIDAHRLAAALDGRVPD